MYYNFLTFAVLGCCQGFLSYHGYFATLILSIDWGLILVTSRLRWGFVPVVFVPVGGLVLSLLSWFLVLSSRLLVALLVLYLWSLGLLVASLDLLWCLVFGSVY